MAKDSTATTKVTTKRTRKSTTKGTTLTLTDPRAIRAIAHEARQHVIDELPCLMSDPGDRP